MILIDTSIWADHFDRSDPALMALGAADRLVMHPFVIGELAAGNLHPWQATVAALRKLPQVPLVDEDSFFDFAWRHKLMGTGLSFVDIHLLASVATISGAMVWTRDKRLQARAAALGCAHISA